MTPGFTQNERPTAVVVGSRGWDFVGWVGGFYPADLPAHWRLTYYANEYPAVLVPERQWRSWSRRDALGFAEDVSERFRFFLEIRNAPVRSAGWDPVLECADLLAGGLGGVLCDPGLGPGSAAVPESLVASLFEVLRPASPGADTGIRSGVGGKAVIAEAEGLGDLRAQRRLLETLVEGLPRQREVPFFLAGSSPSPKILQDLKQLVELMGLA